MPKSLRDHAASMRPPRDRVTCLLVGNHSAGKSSFINWFDNPPILPPSSFLHPPLSSPLFFPFSGGVTSNPSPSSACQNLPSWSLPPLFHFSPSSLIPRYIGDKVQSESVAMETAGFTIIRKGLKRATWKGDTQPSTNYTL
jgi:hypothetical protein